jgi:hypothetical protein
MIVLLYNQFYGMHSHNVNCLFLFGSYYYFILIICFVVLLGR